MIEAIRAHLAAHPDAGKRAVMYQFSIGAIRLEKMIKEGNLKFKAKKPTWCARKRT